MDGWMIRRLIAPRQGSEVTKWISCQRLGPWMMRAVTLIPLIEGIETVIKAEQPTTQGPRGRSTRLMEAEFGRDRHRRGPADEQHRRT
jgi:hypothetical protein